MNDTEISRTDAEKREALRAKINDGQARLEARSLSDQARSAADSALGYVKANPIKTVAAVAVGALVIGAMTRPGRNAGKRAGKLAAVASEAALAYAMGLFESGKDAASSAPGKLADLGDTARRSAREWSDYAAQEGSELSDYLIAAAKRSGKRASKTIDDLRSRIAH